MVLFFVAFPRGSWRSPVAGFRSAASGRGTLLDSVLDPARSATAQSRHVVLQIQGENIGYLRCYALTEFDGQRWSVSRRERLHWMSAPSANALARCLHRRVLVKDVAMLDRELPADGFVARVEGRFFRRPMRNSQDVIQRYVRDEGCSLPGIKSCAFRLIAVLGLATKPAVNKPPPAAPG